MNKTIFLLFLSLFTALSNQAQETTKNPFSISMDVVSRYVWRGTQFGNDVPNVQPELTYTSGKFTAGIWGSYAIGVGGAQEADIYLKYNIKKNFSITLTDYYFPDEYSDYKYFDYNKDSTGHILEASINYDGGKNIPLEILLATNFYGADAHKINDDYSTGDIMYSTYAELTYSFHSLDAFIGANLTNVNTDKGESGFYGDGIGIVNIGISTRKELQITDSFSLPLNLSIITNPQAEKFYMVVGFSL